MTLAYTAKLGLTTQKTSVRVQKIDSLPLESYGMVLASFSLQDSLRRIRFFEEIFLLTDTNMEVVLEMSFLSLSNVNIEFAKLKKLTWRSYTAVKTLLTISRIELIDKREFVRAVMDENSETFVIYISVIAIIKSSIYSSRVAQIAAL